VESWRRRLSWIRRGKPGSFRPGSIIPRIPQSRRRCGASSCCERRRWGGYRYSIDRCRMLEGLPCSQDPVFKRHLRNREYQLICQRASCYRGDSVCNANENYWWQRSSSEGCGTLSVQLRTCRSSSSSPIIPLHPKSVPDVEDSAGQEDVIVDLDGDYLRPVFVLENDVDSGQNKRKGRTITRPK
jgi:hypothetical protein